MNESVAEAILWSIGIGLVDKERRSANDERIVNVALGVYLNSNSI